MSQTILRQKTGILVDTNLLVLYLVGRCSPVFVDQCKQTKRYSQSDFWLLQERLTDGQQVVVTPHILAETSNLLEGQSYRGVNLLTVLADFITEPFFAERYISASALVYTDRKCLAKFGISDTATAIIAQDNLLVLTDDFKLCAYLQNVGIDALNFQNLRDL